MKIDFLSLYKFIAQYGLPFFTAFALSLVFTPIARRLAVRYKFVVYPKQDRWRKRVVATLGGIAIFGAFLVSYLTFGSRDLTFIGFIVGALGIFWLGLVDDIFNIKPDTKLIGQIIIASIVTMFGIRFEIASNQMVNVPLTILWIVGIINAFNLLDNMDGLCAGVASISALILWIYAVMNNNRQLMILELAVLGSTLGFLRYNSNPAKIFMGDCGSMFLGYALSIAALTGAVKEKASLLVTMAIPVLILAVPIFDTIFVTLTRALNNRPISQGGKDHTSHRLVALGLSEKKAVLLLYVISGACGLFALMYGKLKVIHIFILLAVLFIGIFIFGIFLGTEVKVYSEQDLNNAKNRKRLNGNIIFNGFIYNKRRIVEVILDFIIISVAYCFAFLLRFEGVLFDLHARLILESLPIVLVIKFLMFYLFGLYRGVWRYIGLYDIIAIFKAASLSSVLLVFTLFFLYKFENYSRTIFIIDWLITLISISGIRILFRIYKEFFVNIRMGGRRALIFGAGDAGELTLREIRQNRSLDCKPIGFVDDDDDKLHRIIHGIRVLGRGSDLEKLIYKHKIEEVLVAIPASNKTAVEQICEVCNKTRVVFREVSKILQTKKG